MKKYAIFALLVLALFYCRTGLYAAPHSAGAQDTMIVKLSVSEQQEKNFNAFMAWLQKHKSLAKNDSLRLAYQSVFAALKKNDVQKYFRATKQLDRVLTRVTDAEKQDMYNFFLTLTPIKDSSPHENGNNGLLGGKCKVSCVFGSCEITCPPDTKPKCFCQWGSPHCGCEPYEIE